MGKSKKVELHKKLAADTYNVLQNRFKAKKEDTLWTIYQPCIEIDNFNIKGYKGLTKHMFSEVVKTIVKRNKKDGDMDKLKYYLRSLEYENCFTPHNTRATNDLVHKYNLAYLVERNYEPSILNFYKDRNVEITEKDIDIWRLSEIIQWVWRSRIRNQEQINLYIPSKKMRDVFMEYLSSDSFENANDVESEYSFEEEDKLCSEIEKLCYV